MNRLVVIGAAAGALPALQEICSSLPADFPGAVLIVVHLAARESYLPAILAGGGALPVRQAVDGQIIEKMTVLLAPLDRHMTVRREAGVARVVLTRGPQENFARPAIDPLFRSAAAEFGPEVIGVILSGYLDDGTAGLQAIKACGGLALVQDPLEAMAPDMPASAIEHVDVDVVLTATALGAALDRLARTPRAPALRGLPGLPGGDEIPLWIRIENKFALGTGSMADIATIGAPSTYTCPECSGTLWELNGGAIQRFRCHTGHGFTAEALAQCQARTVEEALWTALRALHEKQALATHRAAQTVGISAAQHQKAAREAAAVAEAIRKLLL